MQPRPVRGRRNDRRRPAQWSASSGIHGRGQVNSPAARPYLRRLALRTDTRDTAPIAGATVNQSPMVTTIAVM